MATPTDAMHLAAWRTLQATKGEAIVYHVTTTQSIAIAGAVLTMPKATRIDSESIGLASRSWNWLIDPADLTLDNEQVIPTEGHWIMRGTQRYKLTPGEGKPLVWRWSDASQVWRRIFVEEA